MNFGGSHEFSRTYKMRFSSRQVWNLRMKYITHLIGWNHGFNPSSKLISWPQNDRCLNATINGEYHLNFFFVVLQGQSNICPTKMSQMDVFITTLDESWKIWHVDLRNMDWNVDSPTNIEEAYHETHRGCPVHWGHFPAEWAVKGFQKTKWPMDVRWSMPTKGSSKFIYIYI